MNKMKPKKTSWADIVNDKVASPSEAPAGSKGKLFRNQFKKSQLCHYHFAGKCKSGTACPFAHDASELSEAPDLTKTSMCKAFIAGNCDKSSDECKFAHGEEDLRTTPLFEACSLGNQIQKKTLGLGTPCIHEVDMPPLCETSKLNTSPKSDIWPHCHVGKVQKCKVPKADIDFIDKSTTWMCAAQSWRERSRCSLCSRFHCCCFASDIDQIDSPPICELPEGQLWLTSMTSFAVYAPMHERDMLVTVLQSAAPDQYDD